MAQRWYFGGTGDGCAAPYLPATWKGAWDLTGTGSCLVAPWKVGTTRTFARAESVTTSPYTVGVFRGVSPQLAAQTLTGTLDMVLALLESSSLADFFTKIYVYVTQGDSDLVRGVLLDYEETSAGGATEWPTTAAGRALQAAQALTNIGAITEGDRLVVELGYRSENTSATSRTGTYRTGGRTSAFAELADLTVGSTSVSTSAGFLDFENTITLAAAEPTNNTPETATPISALPYDSGAIDVGSSTKSLWWTRTVTADDRGVLGVFAGVSDDSGNLVPKIRVFKKVAGVYERYNGTGLTASFQALGLVVDVGDEVYLQVYSDITTEPPGRSLRVTAIASPAVGTLAQNAGNYLITEDAAQVYTKGAIVDKDTGLNAGHVDTVVSENGTVLDDGTVMLSDKQAANDNRLVIYDGEDFSVLATVTAATVGQGAGGQANVPVATDGTAFFAAEYRSGLGAARVSRITAAGAVTDTWDVDVHSSGVRAIAVARDASVLYYVDNQFASSPVQRWDLVGDVALADFVTPPVGYLAVDLFVLQDDSILISYTQVAGGGGQVRRYSADGTLLDTFTFTDPFTDSQGDWFLDHIAPTHDDPDAFAVWFQQSHPTVGGYQQYVLRVVTIATGATASELGDEGEPWDAENGIVVNEPDVAVPTTYWGVPNSCPLLVLGARAGGGGGEEPPGDDECVLEPVRTSCWGEHGPVSAGSVAETAVPTQTAGWTGEHDPDALTVRLIG